MNYQETKWPNGQCTGLWVKRSGSRPGGLNVLCSLTIPFSIQEYKKVLENCQGSLMKCWEGNLGMEVGGSSNTPVSCYVETGIISDWVGQ